MAPQDPEDDWWAWILGRWATPRQMWTTFWDDARVKHDPEDKDSPDWDDSEPDSHAP